MKKEDRPIGPATTRVLREAALYGLLGASLFVLIALVSYHGSDSSWSRAGLPGAIRNLGGRAGAWTADLLFAIFGYVAFVVPVAMTYYGVRFVRGREEEAERHAAWIFGGGLVLTLAGTCGLAVLAFSANPLDLPFSAGGLFGTLVESWLVRAANPVGAGIALLAALLAGLTLVTRLSWLALMDRIGAAVFAGAAFAWEYLGSFADRVAGQRARASRKEVVIERRKIFDAQPPPHIEPMAEPEPSRKTEEAKQMWLPVVAPSQRSATLPGSDCLDSPTPAKRVWSAESLRAMGEQLASKLLDFNIETRVVDIQPGPVITRFELEPAPGIKSSQISGVARDLARAMSVVSLRVVENIPGKSVIGIEIPNEFRQTVRLRELIESTEFMDTQAHLTLALGKDIAGRPVVADLAKMPHLLIAGTTGSGKSVCMNALILSLLFKATPADVRLIMIDPKMLELSAYEGIPHLLAPVVTDMKEAANALRWCIIEMERRYRLMSALGVRNLAGFNRKVSEAAARGQPILDPILVPGKTPEPLEPLPYIAVLIDELADLMMVVGKKVEELIARLAQKARASGLHLILATQRPSVDVITGLIKANIPTRIAFQVSARVDSRTVLDQMGAEQLLGHGDMLFLQAGSGVPTRVHGAFVDDHEVHRVVDVLRGHGGPAYNERILSGEADEGVAEPDYIPGEERVVEGEADALYDEALRIVTETRKASISGVQRRLRVGYNRAARMIEDMERAGVVGPLQSNGMREVLAPPPPGESVE